LLAYLAFSGIINENYEDTGEDKVKRIILALLLAAICSTSWAAGVKQRIVLLDNSVIIGEIVEMKDGIYTIRTETVGEIKVSADKIIEISKHDADRPAASGQNIDIIDRSKKPARKQVSQPRSMGASDDLKAQQERANAQVQSMATQEDFLDDMMNLSGSENMLDVMSDPEVMEAISRNDYEFLMNNEKMKNLMESSEIKDLLGE
jgi:hypothetical protein